MGRPSRKVLAVNIETGERKEFESAYDCSIFFNTGHANVRQAIDRNGVCCGWKLYDSPDNLRKRIAELQRQLAEIEA